MTELPPQLRRALAADAASIAAVLHSSFIEFKPLYTEAAFAATAPSSEQIQRRMAEGPIWVAISDGLIVGTVSAVRKGDAFYIRGMGVVPSARGGGIAESLLRQVESAAQENRCHGMLLSTTPFLTSAIRLYERFGFVRTEEGPYELFGTPLFTMAKNLDSGVESQHDDAGMYD